MNNNSEISTVVWDWNGTLLNDAWLCLQTINSLLSKRNLPRLTPERYSEIFTFPVENYYVEAGFDLVNESFSVVAHEFIDLYLENISKCNLHENVETALQFFKNKGIKQIILSAMEHDALVDSVKKQGIYDFFNAITGITDHYARSKIETGLMYFEANPVDMDKVLLIGDTLHDYELATKLKCRCILVNGSHQSIKKLKTSGTIVFNNLSELSHWFENENLRI